MTPASIRSNGCRVSANMNKTGAKPVELIIRIHLRPLLSESMPRGIPTMTMVIPSAPTMIPTNRELIPTCGRYAVKNTVKYPTASEFRERTTIRDLTLLGTPERKPGRVESKRKTLFIDGRTAISIFEGGEIGFPYADQRIRSFARR